MLPPSKKLLQFWYEGQKDLIENHSTIYKYIDAESCLKILENCSIAFKNPLSFNDPYDFSLKLLDFSNIPKENIKLIFNDCYHFLNRKDRKKIWKAGNDILKKNLSSEVERLVKLDVEHHGVTCFSAESNNLLMWSHYAQSHTGVCIGFDLVELFHKIASDSNSESMIRKVDYQDQIVPFQYLKDWTEASIRWMTTKAKVWEYEKEIRIVLSFLKFNKDNLHFQKINQESFKSIFLGSKISANHEQKIREHCNSHYPNIGIQKMKLADNEFKLTT